MSEDNQETAKNQEKDNNSDVDKATKNAEAFIDLAVKSIAKHTAKYAPAIGSGSLLVSFIHEQEWLKALLTSLVSIPAVIWIKYSQGFVTRLGEIYDERGKKDVDSLMKWINNADQAIQETIKWRLAGVEDKYLNCLKITDDSLFYLTEGLEQKDTSLSLADVFIELKITGQNIPTPVGFNYAGRLS